MPCHEVGELDAEPGACPARAAEHGRELDIRVPGGGRDVDVSPWLPAGELRDEYAAHDGPRLAVLGVAEVGDLAAQQDAIVGVDRQAPDAVARLARRALDHG